MIGLYTTCDCLVHLIEGRVGLPVLEAMAILPVIYWRRGGR